MNIKQRYFLLAPPNPILLVRDERAAQQLDNETARDCGRCSNAITISATSARAEALLLSRVCVKHAERERWGWGGGDGGGYMNFLFVWSTAVWRSALAHMPPPAASSLHLLQRLCHRDLLHFNDKVAAPPFPHAGSR